MKRPLFALLGAACAAIGLAPPAQAGTMTHWSCHSPSGDTSLPIDGWARYAGQAGGTWQEVGPITVISNDCTEVTAERVVYGLQARIARNHNTAAGDHAAWGYNVPADLRLVRFTAWRRAYESCNQSQGYNFGASAYAWNAANTELERTLGANFCGFGGTYFHEPGAKFESGTLSPTSRILFGAKCYGNSNGNCIESNPYAPGREVFETAAFYTVGALAATLGDDASPVVTDVSGPLTGAQNHSGTETVTYNATDTGTGLYRTVAQVKLFGQGDWRPAGIALVDPNGGRCQDAGFTDNDPYEFTYQRPCKTAVTGASLSVDNGQFPPGQHTLNVYVEDATGNRTDVIPAGTFTVAPPAGSGVASADPSPTPPTYAAINGTNASASAILRLNRQSRSIRHGSKVNFGGTLRDENDRPITDAAVIVDQRSYIPKSGVTGPSWAPLGVVKTNAKGAFTAQIPAGASRALRLSYKAHPEQPGFTAAAEARILVSAGVSLTARRKTVRNGKIATFTGKVSGAVPASGLTVVLQAYVRGRGWTPAQTTKRTVRTSKTGRFTARYRFTDTRIRRSFKFRVVVQRDSAFAFGQGVSRTVKITVKP